MLAETLTVVGIAVGLTQVLGNLWRSSQRNSKATASERDTSAYHQLIEHARLLQMAGRPDLAAKKAEQAYRSLVTTQLYPRPLQPPYLWLPLILGFLAPLLTAWSTFLHTERAMMVMVVAGLILLVVSAAWAVGNMFWLALSAKRLESQILQDAKNFWSVIADRQQA